MSLVVATWAVAGVTLLLVVVAALTARFAVMAFRTQAEEVSDQKELIKQQSERLEIQRQHLQSDEAARQVDRVLSLHAEFSTGEIAAARCRFSELMWRAGRQPSACTHVGVQHGIAFTRLALAAARKSTDQGFSERIHQICTPGIIGPFTICAKSCGVLNELTWLEETRKSL